MKGGETTNRARQSKWDLENLHSVGTKLLPAQHEMLRRACELEGVSMYALTKRLLMEWLFCWVAENPERVKDIVVLR